MADVPPQRMFACMETSASTQIVPRSGFASTLRRIPFASQLAGLPLAVRAWRRARSSRERRIVRRGGFGGVAVGAVAVGAFALGALAIGALSIGAVAIGRLVVRDLRVGKLSVEELQYAV
jgi:hypothetical protein